MELREATEEVIIIGAGLAGLACAVELQQAGIRFQILEAADGVGGRVRTDVVDGFRLDRGFQVLLTAYPEARRLLDYNALQLCPFFNGADVHLRRRSVRVADPMSHPWQALRGLATPVGTLRDKWFVLLLRKQLHSLHSLPVDTRETSSEDLLQSFGFSDKIIDRFFRPFFGGIFLERELRTSSRVFQFIFAMLAQGGIAVPAMGMQAIPDQLAARLPLGSIRLNTAVKAVSPGAVTLASGEILRAPHIVLATDENVAARLLQQTPTAHPQRAVTSFYFTTDDPSLPSEPIVHLDGEDRGPVNNACIMSNVAPECAPAGQRLISASVLGAPDSTELESAVRDQLTAWFGPSVTKWRLLKSSVIHNAHPEARQLHTGTAPAAPVLAPGLYRCGDYLEQVSINGALSSGHRAAQAITALCGKHDPAA